MNTMLSQLFHFSVTSTILWIDSNFAVEIYCHENPGTEKCENQDINFWYFVFINLSISVEHNIRTLPTEIADPSFFYSFLFPRSNSRFRHK